MMLGALEGEHPVGLSRQPRHVRRGRPSAVDGSEASLVFARPTGERATLSDVHGDVVLP